MPFVKKFNYLKFFCRRLVVGRLVVGRLYSYPFLLKSTLNTSHICQNQWAPHKSDNFINKAFNIVIICYTWHNMICISYGALIKDLEMVSINM